MSSTPCRRDQRRQRRLRPAHVVPRLERIDRVGRHHLAGRIDHRDLHPGPHPGIEPHRRPRPGRRRQQQVARGCARRPGSPPPAPARAASPIRSSIIDSPSFTRHAQRAASRSQRSPGRSPGDPERPLDHRRDPRQPVGVRPDVDAQHPLVGPAHHRQRPVARHPRPPLGVVEIVRELRPLLLLPLDHPRRHHALALEERPEPPEQRRVLAELLGQDVARPGQRLLRVRRPPPTDSPRPAPRAAARRSARIASASALQPALPRDHRLGPPLRLERQVQVLERRLGPRRDDRRLELRRQLALLAHRPEDRRPPRLHLAQVAEPVGEGAELRVVEPAGRLLAVARDEGHRRPAVEQRRRRRRPARAAPPISAAMARAMRRSVSGSEAMGRLGAAFGDADHTPPAAPRNPARLRRRHRPRYLDPGPAGGARCQTPAPQTPAPSTP